MQPFRAYRPRKWALGLAVLAACVVGASALQRVHAETTVTIAYFDDALEPYGYWVDDPVYGRVWRPTRVPDDWGPYTRGSWVYTREYGWVWVSDEPYGWVVYHYGHWVWTDRWGWVWVAGYDWAPAWVEWCYGGGYVGWRPMPPDLYWQDAYYYGRYNCTEPAYYSRAVFVSETYFGRSGMSAHYEPRSRNKTVAVSASVNVTAYVRGRAGIVNTGIDVKTLEAATGHAVNVLPVVQANAPVPGVAGGAMTELQIFRPTVTGLATPQLEGLHSVPAGAQPDLTTPAASALDRGSILGPVEWSRDAPVGSIGPNPSPGLPDLGGLGGGLPSPGGIGGGGGLLGR